jgi:hypothetical protein
LITQSNKKIDEHLHSLPLGESSKVCVSISDYASQIEVPNFFNSTCSFERKINLCVLVLATKKTKKGVHIKGKKASDDKVEVIDSQDTDVFYGLFDPDNKASAFHYNMMREDVEHWKKYGTFLHGEGFVNRERIPLKGGTAHHDVLPDPRHVDKNGDMDVERTYSLKDIPFISDEASALLAECRELMHHQERDDGSATQYQGKKNVGRVARALFGLTQLYRHSNIGVTMHGKAIADALGYLLKRYLNNTIRTALPLQSGARGAVLYLAQHQPVMSNNVNIKEGSFQPKRLIYIYYGKHLWSKQDPDYQNSMPRQYHYRTTKGEPNAAQEEEQGKVFCRKFQCPCPNCSVLVRDYQNCQLKRLVGEGVTISFKKVPGSTVCTTRRKALIEFVDSLNAGEVRAVGVSEDEQSLEGPYWLIHLVEGPVKLDSVLETEFGERFPQGSFVVKAQYYSHISTRRNGDRVYSRVSGVQTLHVACIVRTESPLQLEKERSSYVLSKSQDQHLLQNTEDIHFTAGSD